jgi:hypothetical protein
VAVVEEEEVEEEEEEEVLAQLWGLWLLSAGKFCSSVV